MRTLRIASRKSDLARIQAIAVGSALLEKWPELKLEFQFSESLGDKNLTDPLWKIPEKGVFTSDLTRSLLEGHADLVVHSWKDLPVEADLSGGSTVILGSTLRADSRDVVLFSREAIDEWKNGKTLRVLSSSPRREANLKNFLQEYLPHAPSAVEFHSVRGNIPTRIQKLLDRESGAHALVVARAALERLLTPPHLPPWSDFEGVAARLRSQLSRCLWIICPLSENPPAPGQGALALEVRTSDPWVHEIVKAIVDGTSSEDARAERRILAEHGGGCHQAIGISYSRCAAGRIRQVRGMGKNERELMVSHSRAESSARLWSTRIAGAKLFQREVIDGATEALGHPSSAENQWRISHPDALPTGLRPEEFPFGSPALWCSGKMTWRELARRGWWVEGCDDSLGESSCRFDSWRGHASRVIKLEHAESPSENSHDDERLATYRLIPLEFTRPREELKLEGKTHFFWRSFSQYQRVVELCTEIRQASHACGPGHTATLLSQEPGVSQRLEIFLDEEDWRRNHGYEG